MHTMWIVLICVAVYILIVIPLAVLVGKMLSINDWDFPSPLDNKEKNEKEDDE